ncbi:MAG: tRNA (guanosine(46)-N7)-methyltransferase TrmB [Phycisphaerales bacterium]|jgi:tRNA (guanine-N7-)-methyltransferase|nr:tRNA (guanosine(46)-N7)-methyltransferase TrmB [Phycisphaerales bacterium]
MSFGLSRGRSLDTSGYGIEADNLPAWDGGVFDPRTLFAESDRPFELEVGSGKGTFLVQQAANQPNTNFLGIEWSSEFYRYAADRLRRNQLSNVRILHDNGSEFLRFKSVACVVDVLHLYFTDPWPKTRHHKRRFVQNATMEAMHRVLTPGGCVHLVTDHDDLWAWYVNHAQRYVHLFEQRPFCPPSSAGSGEVVGTNFERKYRREGRPFHAMTLVRRPPAAELTDAP